MFIRNIIKVMVQSKDQFSQPELFEVPDVVTVELTLRWTAFTSLTLIADTFEFPSSNTPPTLREPIIRGDLHVKDPEIALKLADLVTAVGSDVLFNTPPPPDLYFNHYPEMHVYYEDWQGLSRRLLIWPLMFSVSPGGGTIVEFIEKGVHKIPFYVTMYVDDPPAGQGAAGTFALHLQDVLVSPGQIP